MLAVAAAGGCVAVHRTVTANGDKEWRITDC
jgi:hypothetical protein